MLCFSQGHGQTGTMADSRNNPQPSGGLQTTKTHYFCSSLLDLNNYKLKKCLGFFSPVKQCQYPPGLFSISEEITIPSMKSRHNFHNVSSNQTPILLFPEQTSVVNKATLCIWNNLIYYLDRTLVLDKYKLKFNSADTNLSPSMDIENLSASDKQKC